MSAGAKCAGSNRSPATTVYFGLDGTCATCGRILPLTHIGRIPGHALDVQGAQLASPSVATAAASDKGEE